MLNKDKRDLVCALQSEGHALFLTSFEKCIAYLGHDCFSLLMIEKFVGDMTRNVGGSGCFYISGFGFITCIIQTSYCLHTWKRVS